jgi:hypothetical protein
MADTRPFDTYFANRTELVGQQSSAGDEFLVLRGGTVFRGNQVFNKAFAYAADDSDVTSFNTVDVWEPIANTLVQGVTTPTFTYANNQFTYIGPNQVVQNTIYAAMSCKTDGSPATNFDIGIFVNDLLVGNGMTSYVTTGLAFVSTQVQRILVTGDVIDLRVRNRGGATPGLILQNIQLVIS